jgi:hypothetical protein
MLTRRTFYIAVLSLGAAAFPKKDQSNPWGRLFSFRASHRAGDVNFSCAIPSVLIELSWLLYLMQYSGS